MSEFLTSLSELKIAVESELDRILKAAQYPPPLIDAIRYSVTIGGKRLRPALVLMACEICGGDRQDALPAACAIEMIHTYSLIHDDLPSMDDDDLRRGHPTSHRVFGEALAILAGDGLQTLAFETLAGSSLPGDVAVDCLRILSVAAGGAGMIGGQILDLEAERGPFPSTQELGESSHLAGSVEAGSAVAGEGKLSENANLASGSRSFRVEELIKIHRMKTGALITASLQLGAAVAEATSSQRQALTQYGQCAGLAFQIADDLLDVTGNNEKLGKETGRDNALGKLTYPSLIGLDGSREKASGLITEACDALAIFGGKAEFLEKLARFIVERDH